MLRTTKKPKNPDILVPLIFSFNKKFVPYARSTTSADNYSEMSYYGVKCLGNETALR